jgi:ABC-type nitrate/sulfonate/bicarbonate transport system ATPase subunit
LLSENTKIDVRGITKVFRRRSGGVLALDGVSFGVAEGEFVCMVGPSGCGKTTLLRILAGLDRQTSGKVYISVGANPEFAEDTGELVRYRALVPGEIGLGQAGASLGCPSNALGGCEGDRPDRSGGGPNVARGRPTPGEALLYSGPLRSPRPLASVVFQEQSLFPWMTVRDNVEYGLRLRGVPVAHRRRIAEHYIELIGLSGFARAYPHQLSGGMKQRASVARAFANDPEILLMDEPFGSLDEQTRVLLQQELLRIWERSRKTAIFITHSIDEAIALGDRVIVMTARPGRVKASIDVTLPRPRQVSEIRGEPGFLPLFNTIRSLLSEEVLRAREIEASSKRERLTR